MFFIDSLEVHSQYTGFGYNTYGTEVRLRIREILSSERDTIFQGVGEYDGCLLVKTAAYTFLLKKLYITHMNFITEKDHLRKEYDCLATDLIRL